MDTQTVDVDNIIDRLLEVRGSKPGQQVDLEEHEIRYLCSKARSIFIKQPILLELEAPIKVCFQLFFLQFYFYHSLNFNIFFYTQLSLILIQNKT